MHIVSSCKHSLDVRDENVCILQWLFKVGKSSSLFQVPPAVSSCLFLRGNHAFGVSAKYVSIVQGYYSQRVRFELV